MPKRSPSRRYHRAILLLCLLLTSIDYAGSAPRQKSSSFSGKPLMLYGHIDELSYVCSAAGVKLAGNKLPAPITKIALGSAAAYSGIRAGDKVIAAQMDDNLLRLTVERQGKIYQVQLATDVQGLKAALAVNKVRFSFGDSPFDQDLKLLSNCEIFILLDRSASMNDTQAGVPGDLSKWMWCKQQLDNLYLASHRILDNGFNLILFNDKFQERQAVTFWDLRQVFDHIKPEGPHKNIAAPLESILTSYFKRTDSERKPLVIMVLTDGKENIGAPLQTVLINATNRMTHQGQVVITFLQVGNSISADELFDDLDNNLIGKSAKFDIAEYKTFAELRNKGLLWELIKAIKETGAPASTMAR